MTYILNKIMTDNALKTLCFKIYLHLRNKYDYNSTN